VAQYTAEKLNQLGAKVVTLSDSDGCVYDPDGISGEKFEYVLDLKQVQRGRIREYAEKYDVKYIPKGKPWDIKCDLAFPSATQNEIEKEDAENLVENGVIAVSEGANMPSTNEAIEIFLESDVAFGPGKAANAGGVATSGLEMAQNAMRMSWSRKEVDKRLHNIMIDIHDTVYETSKKYGDPGNYVLGANIAGFEKVAQAMISQGHW
jgi:glutamate dehydrogenase/leucine dehydrogenase